MGSTKAQRDWERHEARQERRQRQREAQMLLREAEDEAEQANMLGEDWWLEPPWKSDS